MAVGIAGSDPILSVSWRLRAGDDNSRFPTAKRAAPGERVTEVRLSAAALADSPARFALDPCSTHLTHQTFTSRRVPVRNTQFHTP